MKILQGDMWNSNILKWASGFIGGSGKAKKNDGTAVVRDMHCLHLLRFVLVLGFEIL